MTSARASGQTEGQATREAGRRQSPVHPASCLIVALVLVSVHAVIMSARSFLKHLSHALSLAKPSHGVDFQRERERVRERERERERAGSSKHSEYRIREAESLIALADDLKWKPRSGQRPTPPRNRRIGKRCP